MPFVTPEHPEPIGTPDELERVGLDPADWYSCAAPDEARGIVGCPVWRECKRPEKGLQGPVRWEKDGETVAWDVDGAKREGPGPLNIGWQLIESRGRKVGMPSGTCACWEIPWRKANGEMGWTGTSKQQQGRGNVFMEVAVEGQKHDIAGSQPDTAEIPGIVIWKSKTISYRIKPQPRPESHPVLTKSAFAAEQIEKAQERLRAENVAELFRLGRVDTPVATHERKKGPGSRG